MRGDWLSVDMRAGKGLKLKKGPRACLAVFTWWPSSAVTDAESHSRQHLMLIAVRVSACMLEQAQAVMASAAAV